MKELFPLPGPTIRSFREPKTQVQDRTGGRVRGIVLFLAGGLERRLAAGIGSFRVQGRLGARGWAAQEQCHEERTR